MIHGNTITSEYEINTKDVELYIDISVNGEIVQSKKSDSLVGNFIRGFYSMMGGGLEIPTLSSVNEGDLGNSYNQDIVGIDVSSGGGVKVTLTTANNAAVRDIPADPGSKWVQISGVVVGDGTPDINGVWEVTQPTEGVATYEIVNLSADPAYEYDWAQGATMIDVYKDETGISVGSTMFRDPVLVLSSDNTPVTADQWYVPNMIRTAGPPRLKIDDPSLETDEQIVPNTISRGSEITISSPVFTITNSTFTVTQSFTNQCENTIEVNKAGMFADISNKCCLIACDLLPEPIQLGVTETISINYKIVNNVSGSVGGILNNFSKLLFTTMGGGQTPTRDVDDSLYAEWYANQDGVNNYVDYPFVCNTPNYMFGNTPMNFTANNLDDLWKMGPVLGTADPASYTITAGDNKLQTTGDVSTLIENGTGPDRLVYYPAYVTDFEESPTETKFKIWRFVENQTDAPITATQIGLYTAIRSKNNSSGSTYSMFRYFCVASNYLLDELDASAPITINPGEFYRIEVILAVKT